MVHKFKQRVIAPNLDVLNQSGRLTPGTGVPGIAYNVAQTVRARIGLAGFTISLPSASDFGGGKIADFPNKNLLIRGYVLNIKGTVSSPNVGTDLTFGLGTAVAAATPLATTAIAYMLSLIHI